MNSVVHFQTTGLPVIFGALTAPIFRLFQICVAKPGNMVSRQSFAIAEIEAAIAGALG